MVTSTSPVKPASARSAARTASAVPRGGFCTATAAAPSRAATWAPTCGEWAPHTTTMGAQPSACAASMARSSRVRRPTWCSTLGRGERMRVPCPAARMTAARALNGGSRAAGAGSRPEGRALRSGAV